jgi:hypothetical protein
MHTIRPSYEDIIKCLENNPGAILCSCQRALPTFELIRDHWEKGHFDKIVNYDEIIINNINKKIEEDKKYIKTLTESSFGGNIVYYEGIIAGLEIAKVIILKENKN